MSARSFVHRTLRQQQTPAERRISFAMARALPIALISALLYLVATLSSAFVSLPGKANEAALRGAEVRSILPAALPALVAAVPQQAQAFSETELNQFGLVFAIFFLGFFIAGLVRMFTFFFFGTFGCTESSRVGENRQMARALPVALLCIVASLLSSAFVTLPGSNEGSALRGAAVGVEGRGPAMPAIAGSLMASIPGQAQAFSETELNQFGLINVIRWCSRSSSWVSSLQGWCACSPLASSKDNIWRVLLLPHFYSAEDFDTAAENDVSPTVTPAPGLRSKKAHFIPWLASCQSLCCAWLQPSSDLETNLERRGP
eukprot:s152_g3.t1